ncbi:Cytosine deaminase-related metal-dependent hydrolase [Cupriavidus gilardii CR3]|nr:Cytosine deaminase-related metal-dependent hydrolase [Cupriavidus gilardii CR3]
MTLILIHADVLVTMDANRREIADGALVAEGPAIQWVGATADLPADWRARIDDGSAQVLDMRGHVVLPGLINTHHHMYQSLTRAVPAAQDAELFGWLGELYMLWANLTPRMIAASTRTAMAELMLSGCTTTSDHLYLYPNGSRLDDAIEAAAQMGMRFHAARGSMSVGRSKGGLPPDAVVEQEEAILRDSQRLIEQYHDASRHAMLRVVLAPCSPFSVSRELMRESATMARHYGVSLHTHLAENDNDVAYSLERFGMTPAQYAEDLGWVGHDVWHAHCVKLDADGIALFARTGTGVAHCPCSNMRLASGIAPVRAMRDAGVPVGLGVDGSASNDGAHMLGEARQAMLLQRVGYGPAAMGARGAGDRHAGRREGAEPRRYRRACAGHVGRLRRLRHVGGRLCRRRARSGRRAGVLHARHGVGQRDQRQDSGARRRAAERRSADGADRASAPGAGTGRGEALNWRRISNAGYRAATV